MLYTIYKTVNILNEKEYVGFHKVQTLEDILYEVSEKGSIFKDGYMGSGKLMKWALEKYGPENMYQELLFVSEDKKEAEEKEKNIVNESWIESDDNYNLVMGGNVCILFGEKNGFYGRKHSSKTIEKIQKYRNKTKLETPFSWSKSYVVKNPEKTFLNREEIMEYYTLKDYHEVSRMFYEGILRYNSEYLQNACIRRFKKREDFLNSDERLLAKEKLREGAKKRFSKVPKSEESNRKRSKSIREWIKNNPEKHKLRMDKINRNPEKIRKTADKHIGMKRSDKTKRNISESLKGKPSKNKDKIYINDGQKTKMIEKSDNIPEGWHRGYIKRK